MNDENRDLKIDTDTAPVTRGDIGRSGRARFWVNWALAAADITILAATVAQ